MAVEPGVCPAAVEIDNDDGAAGAGIGNEGGVAVGMEANVVQVAALERHVLAETRWTIGSSR